MVHYLAIDDQDNQQPADNLDALLARYQASA
jgi:hypothetical protein